MLFKFRSTAAVYSIKLVKNSSILLLKLKFFKRFCLNKYVCIYGNCPIYYGKHAKNTSSTNKTIILSIVDLEDGHIWNFRVACQKTNVWALRLQWSFVSLLIERERCVRWSGTPWLNSRAIDLTLWLQETNQRPQKVQSISP